jgi:hypothetical protein
MGIISIKITADKQRQNHKDAGKAEAETPRVVGKRKKNKIENEN